MSNNVKESILREQTYVKIFNKLLKLPQKKNLRDNINKEMKHIAEKIVKLGVKSLPKTKLIYELPVQIVKEPSCRDLTHIYISKIRWNIKKVGCYNYKLSFVAN